MCTFLVLAVSNTARPYNNHYCNNMDTRSMDSRLRIVCRNCRCRWSVSPSEWGRSRRRAHKHRMEGSRCTSKRRSTTCLCRMDGVPRRGLFYGSLSFRSAAGPLRFGIRRRRRFLFFFWSCRLVVGFSGVGLYIEIFRNRCAEMITEILIIDAAKNCYTYCHLDLCIFMFDFEIIVFLRFAATHITNCIIFWGNCFGLWLTPSLNLRFETSTQRDKCGTSVLPDSFISINILNNI